ncbi:MAG: nucleotidyltransferase domain-containing protein [Planctomycetota bacterium]
MDTNPSGDHLRLDLPYDVIVDFCKRGRSARLEVFGSVLRDDFRPDSDVDFLVTFEAHARWTLFDLVRAEDELSRLVGRTAELIERPPLEESTNWIRRQAILSSAQMLYVA